jgi:flagellar assembly protein FliH
MAAIIKASGTLAVDEHATQAQVFNFEDMTQQADRYLTGIRGKAKDILVDAQREASTVLQKAEEQGRGVAIQSALKVVRGEMGQEVQQLLPALQAAISQIASARESWIAQWEKNVVHLAGMIAKRVIRRELSQQPEISLDLIREALQLSCGAGNIQLHLHPEDQKTLGEQAELMLRELGHLGNAEIVPNPQISRGGCRVETQHGSIDQQIETQLNRIEQELC